MKNRIYVETKDRRFDTAPELYGLFFEDINRAADGGLYPEMIRNRAFEDSLIQSMDGQVRLMAEREWMTGSGL